jgi:hypothetical protein
MAWIRVQIWTAFGEVAAVQAAAYFSGPEITSLEIFRRREIN